jgi:ATP-binding cassette subfamily F protein 3
VIAVQGISKFLGDRELFKDITFHIQPGERVGLIGPNGAGKTTLFSILRGETEPDEGSVVKAKSMTVGYLPQELVPLSGKTILAHATDVHEQAHALKEELESIQHLIESAYCSEDQKELALKQSRLMEQFEHLGGYDLEARAQKVLAGLGFRQESMLNPMSSLSGGWIMRLELARLLLAEPDLLLLDEPTNHLDLSSLLWLEQYLLNTRSAVLVVSHDRYFLNNIIQRLLEIDSGRMHEYNGDYDRYLEEKSQRQEIQLASYKNQQDRIRQMERFIDRNRVRASTARRAQSRMKILEKVERIEAPTTEAEIHFTFPEPPRSGKRVLELLNVSKAYGDKTIYQGVDLLVEKGDRIGFVGENGAGKSTLLRMLAGVEPLNGGERIQGANTVVGYYAQHQWEQLRPEWTVLQEAAAVAGNMIQSQLRGLLGAFLFSGDDVLKKVSVLSGGEKARLILCKLLLQRPNLLLLDEPTNHLDIPSRDVLETALQDFPGTVCFISHDRHFINLIANKILAVEGGKIHLFPGNYTDFQEIWKQRLESSSLSAGDTGGQDNDDGAAGPAQKNQDQKRLEAERRNALYRLKKPLQKRLGLVETALEEAQGQLDALSARLADPSTYQGSEDVQSLQKEYQAVRVKVSQLSAQWEEAALELEELETNFSNGSQAAS